MSRSPFWTSFAHCTGLHGGRLRCGRSRIVVPDLRLYACLECFEVLPFRLRRSGALYATNGYSGW